MTETNRSTNYRINLNIIASAALVGVTACQLVKTGNFIIIKPLFTDDDVPNKCNVIWLRGKNVQFTVMRFVSDGSIHRKYFRHKYKVKKDKRGWLYVCLNEVVDDG